MSRTAGIRKIIAAALVWVCLEINDLSLSAHDRLKEWGDLD